MRSLFLIIILSFLGTYIVEAQNENNFWYFGNNAGVDFNSGIPAAVTDGQLNTLEGCATVSDYAGNLLFYTDGVNVWNRMHNIMANGDSLMGDSTSTQSALIVKKPFADSVYYIFTAADSGNIQGLRYSVVDLTLNGGLGDVTTEKNIPIFISSCEKITAIRHYNGSDYWIVAHHYGTNSFYSYLLNSSGLSASPSISNVGSSLNNPKGYLKGSRSGKRIASANYKRRNLEVFDFDNETGLISNLIRISNLDSNYVYCVEFSPNSELIYVSHHNTSSYISQFNLLAGSSLDINNSRVQIDSTGGVGGALQIGNDDKIYYAKDGEEYLSVINKPDEKGVLCDYSATEVHLAGKTSKLGLPPFVIYDSFFYPKNLCLSDTTQFHLFVATSVDSVKWDFGDPPSGTLNYSTLKNPTHYYSSLGSYNVSVIIYRKFQTDTLKQTVEIHPYPEVFIGNDTLLCPGDVINLNATSPNASYLWNNGTTSPYLNVYNEGTYTVKVEAKGCLSTDSINIRYKYPKFDLGEDILFCHGETHLLDLNIPDVSYTWQDGSRNPSYLVTQEGKYWVTVKLDECINSDTVRIAYNPIPKTNFGGDTIVCKGQSILLNVIANNSKFLWQDNSTENSFFISERGKYWVYVSDTNCLYLYEVNVELEQCEIEMPNVFTPNNDGLNESFRPLEISPETQGTLKIFNRYGKKIFETENLLQGWSGTCNGKPCSEGTYFWVLNFQTSTYGELKRDGFVTLLK